MSDFKQRAGCRAGAASLLTTMLAAGGALFAPASAAAAPASAAAAPAISVGRQCYVNANSLEPTPVIVSGSGWTPGDTIEISSQQMSGTATVGADGTFVQTLSGEVLGTAGPAQQAVKLTATDQGSATAGTPATGATADASFLIANLAFTTSPREASFNRRVTFSFSGFTAGKDIYAHYLHGKQVVAGQSFGRATGACGRLQKKAFQYPGTHQKYDSYTVQFDDAQRYSKRSEPRIVTTLSVVKF